MSLEYIRRYYDVPAKRGVRVQFNGYGCPLQGVIVGSSDTSLQVRWDNGTKVVCLHPTWMVEYLDD